MVFESLDGFIQGCTGPSAHDTCAVICRATSYLVVPKAIKYQAPIDAAMVLTRRKPIDYMFECSLQHPFTVVANPFDTDASANHTHSRHMRGGENQKQRSDDTCLGTVSLALLC